MTFPPPRIVMLRSGIRIATYEMGAGPAVVFCHGFPELAFTWRHVMPAVAAAGFRCIALDMRGHGRSDRPAAPDAYDIAQLTDDLAGVVDVLQLGKAIFVGHDWGASVVWEMPLLHPGRTAGVVGVNTPRWKYRRWGDDPIAWLRTNHGAGHYMIYFQEPGVAEAAMTGDGDFETAVARRHRKAPFAAFPLDPDVAHQQVRALAEMPIGEPCLSPQEVAYYAEVLRGTGYAGGLNWYRNMQRNARLLHGTNMDIAVPALMVAATHDLFNPPGASLGIETLGPAVERVVLPDSGHWLPDENRADLSDAIVSWLRRRLA